jgi:protein-tyrosine phosphatase
MADIDKIDKVYDRLYISGCWPSLNFKDIKKKGITTIINLMERELYESPSDEYAYLHRGFSDNHYPPHEYLEEILNFLDAHIKNSRVLVHCAMGVSRSGGIVVAWLLMEHPEWSWDDAVKFVKKSHGIYPASEIKESILDFLEKKEGKRRE